MDLLDLALTVLTCLFCFVLFCKIPSLGAAAGADFDFGEDCEPWFSLIFSVRTNAILSNFGSGE